MEATMGDIKWGTAIKLQKGLRIVQRHTAAGVVWYREERVKENGVRRVVRTSLETGDAKEARRKAIAGPEAPAPRPFSVSSKTMTRGTLTLEAVLEEYQKWYEKKYKPSGCAV